eukprot:COSAG06_NODE_5174_length_3662_cov_2.173730_4_plen_187_part_00
MAFLYRRPCRPPRASPPDAAPPASPLRSGPPLCPSPSDASRASAPPAVRSGRENRQRRFLLAGVSRFRLTPTKRSTMACQDRLGTSTRKTRRPLMVHQKPTTINGPPKAVFSHLLDTLDAELRHRHGVKPGVVLELLQRLKHAPAPFNISVKTAETSARKSHKRFQATPAFKLPAVFRSNPAVYPA